MKESLRSRLKKGELLVGTLITLPSPEIGEILAAAGFDWLFVDMEHSTIGAGEAQAILQAVAGRVDCILRVPLNDEIWIKKALDTGAAGVMVPQVNSAENARRAVRFSKYPPQGSRSVGFARAHGYGPGAQEYLERANTDTALVVQIEHIEAVRNLEAILSVEGIDAVLVGPYDLSASMGRMGQVESPEVQAVVEQVKQACLAHGMPLGIFAATAERASDYARQGYRLIAASSDALMLASSAREIVRKLHN
jgi:2-keto-3-deoxy-L-rhamnonate aldolase RhmA